MKTTQALFYSLIFVLGISVSSCDSGGDDPTPSGNSNPPSMGDGMPDDGGNSGGTSATIAPDFSLKNINNQTVTLSSLKGKVVVLFFFGNGCPPCKAVAPSVQSQLANPYSSNPNLVVIGIDQWNGNLASVQGFKNSTGVSFDLLLNGAATASDFETTYDRLLVIDKEGYIRFKGIRGASSDISSAKSTVDEYLNK